MRNSKHEGNRRYEEHEGFRASHITTTERDNVTLRLRVHTRGVHNIEATIGSASSFISYCYQSMCRDG